jgi:hypothetical protein
VATSQNPPQPDEFKLLLDQGFPKPTAFAIAELDRTVEVQHLSDFAPGLAERSTPDWYVYCAAAEAGFNALVVRDPSQLDQLAEMYCPPAGLGPLGPSDRAATNLSRWHIADAARVTSLRRH